MSKVDGSLGSLIQGVSQQPQRARRAGQSETQENVTNNEVSGLLRRPHTDYIGPCEGIEDYDTLRNSTGGIVSNPDGDPIYWRANTSALGYDTISIHDMATGDLEATLGNAAYTPDNSNADLVVRNVGGTLYVLNKTIEPAMDTIDNEAADELGWVIFCRGGATSTEFSFTIFDDTIGEFKVWMKTDDTDTDKITVQWIISQLAGALDIGGHSVAHGADLGISQNGSSITKAAALLLFDAQYTGSLENDHMLILADDDTENTRITVNDGSGTKLIQGINNTVQRLEWIPTRARKNQVVQVRGDDNSIADDYYLQFLTDSVSASGAFEDIDGVWTETASPFLQNQLDGATMPHEITLTAGVYALAEIAWEDRSAGDEDSNPVPKFIGEPIKDLVEFQERFVFLHGQSASLSEVGEHTNFFLQSATTLLDTDPIHITPSSTDNKNLMTHAVLSNRDLVIFATNDAQYTLSGRSKITPSTAAMPLTAEFAAGTLARPVGSGNVVFYSATVGANSEISEMYLLGQDDAHARRSLSNHVPKYIDPHVDSLVSMEGYQTLLAWDSTTAATAVYVYEYLWQDNTRVQAAWSKWKFEDRLVHAYADDEFIYGVFEDTHTSALHKAYVAKIDLTRPASGELDFEVHLDRQQAHSSASIDLPTGPTYEAVFTSGDNTSLAATLTAGTPDGVTGLTPYTVSGGVGDIVTGIPYLTVFVPTMPVIKDRSGVARAVSDLSVARFLLQTIGTGPFRAIRETSFEDPEDYWTLYWEGRTWDDPDFILGGPPVDDARVEFTFEENAATSWMRIECDFYTPMNITEIEWAGSLRGRSTRVNTGG